MTPVTKRVVLHLLSRELVNASDHLSRVSHQFSPAHCDLDDVYGESGKTGRQFLEEAGRDYDALSDAFKEVESIR